MDLGYVTYLHLGIGQTKSLIFPYKVPPVADDRFVQISWQREKYDRALFWCVYVFV